ncbi:MAG: IS110 family transposase [Candidatus Bathyarchaeia archaeon]
MISVGIDVGKHSFQACLKDDAGRILGELSLPNDSLGIQGLIEALKTREAKAVLEATGNQWIRLYDALEAEGVRTVLANPVKTRLIAEARIKTDRLDARILADLLRGNLVAESYVPSKKERDWRSLVRHRASLVRMGVDLKNRIHALLDKYELKPSFSDLFGKAGIEWLESLRLSPFDQIILETNLRLLKSLREAIDSVDKEIASIALEEDAVRLLMTMPGIDFYSAILILAEIGDIHRFPSPSKLASWAGLVPSIHQSGDKAYTGRITKRGSKWLRWILVQAAQRASLSDERLGSLYKRVAARRGHQKAIVAVAREMLSIIWYMLSRKEVYRGSDQRLTETKLKRMRRKALG